MLPPAEPPPAEPPAVEPPAGDPVCWAALVCAACGAMPDGPPPARCDRCGAPRSPGGDAAQ